MLPAEFHSYAVLAIIALMIGVLISDRFKTSRVFLFTSVALILSGAVTVDDFLAGLSNRSILTIFLLVVITAGINQHFNLKAALDRLFRGVSGPRGFILRLGSAVASLSAFMNNTPVVALMIPYVYNWGRERGVSPAKLLMPLSFAAILGGVITLIGTSTNLVLNGLIEQAGLTPLGFFDFTVPGLIITAVALLLILLLAPILLKGDPSLLQYGQKQAREYLIEMRLKPGASMVGKSIERAGLRNLEGVFLSEIIRGNRHIVPVGPEEILQTQDVLLFAGDTSVLDRLSERFPELEMAKTRQFDLIEDTAMVEAIVGQNSLLDRRTAKEVGFRQKYDAAIIGIHRRGEKLSGKIGSLPLHTGDVLLMVAGRAFDSIQEKNDDLIVLSMAQREEESTPLSRKLFGLGLLISILLSAFGLLGLFEALLAILMVQVLLKQVNLDLMKKNLSLDLLIVLLSSLILGQALIQSGAAQSLSMLLFSQAQSWSPLALISLLFAFTWLLTSFITNVAAISIVFPIALEMSQTLGLPPQAVFLTAAFGASCSFLTPYAYQTNLMVLELGKYRFKDFLNLGFWVSLLYGLIFLSYIYLHYLS